ncbi:Uroporphyrinogen III synthase UROS HEM4 [Olea europaea subsp. europaea]|uniref:Uroporphyrinogen III synthase UROS HEM4 n=1 Tax=Olea europaea subsp. europaea TaxID=158383 RepID=A0A8S0RSY6_OLEEU|nr:Uroporphyrinogen III synthase UROS HEM4 [Olea europaea subsp. europaea]
MIVLNLQPPPPLPATRVVAFTTPKNYAGRLSHLINSKGWAPLWCPTVIVESTSQTIASIQHCFSLKNGQISPLEEFSAIAFTSRTGITAFSEALAEIKTPPLPPHGESFILSALGKDSELLDESFINKLCENPGRIRVLVPPVATPTAMVESIGLGQGKKLLCPVPLVIGLEEPPVVPKFLADLTRKGWIPIRLNAYETRWAGLQSVLQLLRKSEEEGGLDAIVFTSTGEVEGLLKSLEEMGLDWGIIRQRCPRMVVAAHGPVTAAGAEALGVGIDVVSSRFDSFNGVVDALAYRLKSFDS